MNRADDPNTAVATEPETPRRPHRSVLFLAGSLATGNGISMVLRMIGGLLIGRFVTPATLGLFNGIGLVLGYIPFLQLGVLNGLNRELPYYVGKGDTKRAKELAASAQAWALAVGTLVFMALVGIAIWELARGDMWKAAGWLTNAFSALFLFYSTYYLQVTFRTAHDFARLAVINVIDAAVALGLLAVVAVLNFYGLCIRSVLVSVITTVLLFVWSPLRVRPRFDVKHFTHLLRIGAPIFATGQAYAWWAVLNSTLVLRFTGTKGMGLYSIVLLAASALDVVPQSVGQVLYPRMAEEYGRSGSLLPVLRILRKPVMFTVVGLVPLVVAGWFLIGPVLELVIPDYVDAAPAARWALLLVFASAVMPITSVFNTIRRQDLFAAALAVGVAAYAGTLVWLIHDHVDLVSFSQALLVGRVVFVVVCYLFAWRLRNKSLPARKPEDTTADA